MRVTFFRRLLSFLTQGRIKAVVFVVLVGFAIGFWMYIQTVFSRVREFQKALVKTQVSIYLSIIDPQAFDNTVINSDLFETVVLDAKYPSIFTDEDMNPLQSYWHNVGIALDDTSEASFRKLRELVENMDRTNPPEPVMMPALPEVRADTFHVYDLPPADQLPLVVTDDSGSVLYTRNINTGIVDVDGMRSIIRMLDSRTPPLYFLRDYDRQLIFHGVTRTNWPLIVTTEMDEPLFWHNIGVSPENASPRSTAQIQTVLNELKDIGNVFHAISEYEVPVTKTMLLHYGDLPFLAVIAWVPVIELLLILLLISIGYIGFKNINNAERRSIWVGMAKETAHQLGTPISSLSGWLELLKTEDDPALLESAIPDMEYDVQRLTRVAARFSNIGSRPELKPLDVDVVCEEVLSYFRARVPRMGRKVLIEGTYTGLRQIMGNRELLNWAFENLVKNALAAINSREGTVRVTASMSKDFQDVVLDFTDNGRGIDSTNFKKIMKPGFTTKKRGWGLGLNLVKRIIEEYHDGAIYLLESKPGVGTTFRVILPVISTKELVKHETKNSVG